MSEMRALLGRIGEFRQRLETLQPALSLPRSSLAIDPAGDVSAVVSPPRSLGQLPPPWRQLRERLLPLRQQWQRHDNEPVVAAWRNQQAEPRLAFHHVTGQMLAVLEQAVELAAGTTAAAAAAAATAPAEDAGVRPLLETVRHRLQVLEQVIEHQKVTAGRIDRLAELYAAMAAGTALRLTDVAALAEEIWAEAQSQEAIRWQPLPPEATACPGSTRSWPVPYVHVAAHALHVAQVLARMLGHDAELRRHPLSLIAAALLMDVGLLALPPDVAGAGAAADADAGSGGGSDAGSVAESYWQHALLSAEWIGRCLAELAPLAVAVAAHHERNDGSGWPQRRRGEEIPWPARLLAVADMYARLREPRGDRPAADGRAALLQVLLAAERGQLDRAAVGLLTYLSFFPVGSLVELNDGSRAVVVAVAPADDPILAVRPTVAVLADATGRPVSQPHVRSLTAGNGGFVVRPLSAEAVQCLLRIYPQLTGG